MNNFTFYNPTSLVFGKGSTQLLREHIAPSEKILVCYGGGSVKKNGVYEAVCEALKDYEYEEFWGIEPNPSVQTVREAVAKGHECNASVVLAVGGGSVVDASKLIAAALTSEKDPWEIILSGQHPTALPLYVVLTVPATGSEMNKGAVISNRSTGEKFSFYCKHPVASFLDPSVCSSLSRHQVSCGLADAFVHTLEQYMTYPGQSGMMDRLAEGELLQILDIAPRCLAEHDKGGIQINTASEYMLAATIGLNGFLSMGVVTDWTTHKIGHEITALCGTTHGESLCMVLPHLYTVLFEEKKGKLAQMARRVFGSHETDKEKAAKEAIRKITEFFKRLGLCTSMAEGKIPEEAAETIIERFHTRGVKWGENGIASPEKIEETIRLSMRQ